MKVYLIMGVARQPLLRAMEAVDEHDGSLEVFINDDGSFCSINTYFSQESAEKRKEYLIKYMEKNMVSHMGFYKAQVQKLLTIEIVEVNSENALKIETWWEKWKRKYRIKN